MRSNEGRKYFPCIINILYKNKLISLYNIRDSKHNILNLQESALFIIFIVKKRVYSEYIIRFCRDTGAKLHLL